jgi:hypothetical protein
VDGATAAGSGPRGGCGGGRFWKGAAPSSQGEGERCEFERFEWGGRHWPRPRATREREVHRGNDMWGPGRIGAVGPNGHWLVSVSIGKE